MFKLSESRGSQRLYCGREGLYLGSSPLIECRNGSYQLRQEPEISVLLAAAYGSGHDTAERLPGLCRVLAALQQGNVSLAMIATLHLRMDEVSEEGIERLMHAEALLKANFNPAQPRDALGRWTEDGTGSSSGDAAASDHPALIPVQEILPFLARPPFFFEEPPRTVRPFKEAIPRLGASEGAKDIPSWARGKRPYVGENGRDFAKRLMDEKYGPGNWRRRSREYRQIQKFGDRSFRDPRSVLVPNDDSSE